MYKQLGDAAPAPSGKPPENFSKTTDSRVYKVGIYGWRKRCLYVFILLLAIVIFVNLTITAWIMVVLNISPSGLHALTISDDGIRVDGSAEFTNPVYVSAIESSKKPLSVESDSAIYLNARDETGKVTSKLFLGEHAQAVCNKLEVYDMDEQKLFSSDREQVTIHAPNLRILGTEASSFEDSIQCNTIESESNVPFKISSPTRSISVFAAQDIEFRTQNGGFEAKGLLGVNLESSHGPINLNAKDIYMKSLRFSSEEGQSMYQLCMCKNGRVFLARGNADCRASRDICA